MRMCRLRRAGDVRVGSDPVSVRGSTRVRCPPVVVRSSVVRRRGPRAAAHGRRPRPTVQLRRPQLHSVRVRRRTAVVVVVRRISGRPRHHAPDQRVFPQRADRQEEPADGGAHRSSADQQARPQLLLRFRCRYVSTTAHQNSPRERWINVTRLWVLHALCFI